MRAKRLLIGLSVLAMTACAHPPATDAPEDAGGWRAPRSSLVYPAQRIVRSAWESFKSRRPTPSTDQHLVDPVLQGAIDIHTHYGPDVYGRQWDAFEIARLAQERGMRGLVFKNHYTETAGLAFLLRKYAAPGMEIFGGLALNTTVGGINPEAVRYFAEVEGGYAKVVWMPTHDSEVEVKQLKQDRPYVRVSTDGVLLPEVLEVLDLIAEHHLTLATGHVSAKEMLMIVAEAKKRGVDRIIITHPNLGPQYTTATIDEMKQAVAMGGYLEIVSNALGKPNRAEILAMIRAIGPAHCIVSTDSGLVGTPNHADALVLVARDLREEGFTEDDLDLMFKTNPARVLGLPVR